MGLLSAGTIRILSPPSSSFLRFSITNEGLMGIDNHGVKVGGGIAYKRHQLSYLHLEM